MEEDTGKATHQGGATGRIHGAEGLLEFTFPRTVVRTRFKIPLEFTTFNRTKFDDKILLLLIRLRHKKRKR